MATNRYGVATCDITPPVGVNLCGYLPRRAESVGHGLRAEALVCDDGERGWALVTLDLLAVSRQFTADVRRGVVARTGLGPESVMLAATHTHSGPNAFAIGWRELPEEIAYFRHLRQTVTDMVVQAWERRAPGELVHTRTKAPELASNRRVRTENGTWTNAWADPDGQHTGYYDPTVDLVGVRRPDGKLDGLLVAFGCHPVCFNRKNTAISADYPGYMKDVLEASGKVGTSLFAVTGHANIDPRECVANDIDVTRRNGTALARIVLEALPSLTPIPVGPAGATLEPWDISMGWNLEGNSASYFEQNKPGETMPTQIGALGMGTLAFLCMPGETVSEYMARFRAESPFAVTIMLSVCNGFAGYLVTDAILAEGAYEASMCPARPVEEALMHHAHAALERVHAEILSRSNP